MKILYISQFFRPERVAAAFRAYDNAKIWIEENADVTIFTAYPNFPTGELFEGYKIKLLSEEKLDGIRVLRSKILIKKNTNIINRGINSLSFLFFGLYNIIFNRKFIGNDFDIVLGTSGTILAPIIAYIFSLINKVPFVLELRDVTYIQMLAVYGGKETIIYKLVRRLELYLCNKAKKIIVVTNGFKNELIKESIPKDKIEVIYNGVDLKNISLINKVSDEKMIFSYMGNIGKSQNVKMIIDIFRGIEIKDYSKELIIIGDGAKKQEILEYVKRNNIQNVIIKDGMQPEELEKYYSISDFCIVSLNNNTFFKNTIPSKIFQIMGRGKNILFFGPDGEASNIIGEVDNKFLYTQGNIKEIMDKINSDLADKNIKLYLNKKGIEFKKITEIKYDRELLSKRYLYNLEITRRQNG